MRNAGIWLITTMAIFLSVGAVASLGLSETPTGILALPIIWVLAYLGGKHMKGGGSSGAAENARPDSSDFGGGW
jgi:hypothetical protein